MAHYTSEYTVYTMLIMNKPLRRLNMEVELPSELLDTLDITTKIYTKEDKT